MEESGYIVYKHTSPSNKVYIGITKQTAEKRWKNGLGYQSSPHFWSAIQKYGWEHMTHEIVFSNLSVDDACDAEKKLIEEYNATDRNYGYNEKSGGQKGVSFTQSVKDKISASRKAYYEAHPEAKKEASERATGYHHTDEAKEKMRAAKIGRRFSQTDEWRRHISEANKETLRLNHSLYEERCAICRDNGKRASKPVEQLDDSGKVIAVYSSAHEAERNTGIRNGNIQRCCVGNTKSAGGYVWRYAASHNSSSETA